ncbi:MAG: O-methyltransferase, partial [Clostridia bacterium]|nr:O-methyltransferase [Clostridia bacterium]
MTDGDKILQGVHDFARENFVMILSDECERELRRLFAQYKPKRVLEIGTAIGYSSSVMALSSDCVIDTIEKDGERIKSAKELWKSLGVDGRIN